jgi:hypothetical protein
MNSAISERWGYVGVIAAEEEEANSEFGRGTNDSNDDEWKVEVFAKSNASYQRNRRAN